MKNIRSIIQSWKNNYQTAICSINQSISYDELFKKVVSKANILNAFKNSGYVPALISEINFESIEWIYAGLYSETTIAILSNQLSFKQIHLLEEDLSLISFHHSENDFLDKLYEKPKKQIHICELKKISTVIFSSASTGTPKAICHTNQNHIVSALASLKSLNITSSDCYYLCLPLFHVSGLSILFRCLLASACIHIKGDFIKTLKESLRITHISMVSSQLESAIRHQINPHRFKSILCGGMAFPSSLLTDALKKKWPIFYSYGSTETASQIANKQLELPIKKLSVGQALNHAEIKLDKMNQICIKSKSLAIGYLKSNILISPIIDEKQYYPTKDVGQFINEELYIIGRIDNLFISGGENIYPEEIEMVLIMHPDIKSVKVIPIECPKFGKVPKAIIQTHHKVDIETLKTFCKNKLEPFKIPKTFEFEEVKTNKNALKSTNLE